MHSHEIFPLLSAMSISLTALSLLSSNKTNELASMLIILAPILASVVLLLGLTRRYWEGLRRVEF